MEHIQELQAKRQERIDHLRSLFSSDTNIEQVQTIGAVELERLEKANLVSVFTPEAVKKIHAELQKAEDTGFWKGEKVSKGDVEAAKQQVEKLQKKIVEDKDGGTKTVYVAVKNETKAHHKMSHDELMEHHSSKELHEIAEQYRGKHDEVKTSVEKNGAADDSYKSQKAEHARGDVATSEQRYMHLKQAAYKKEQAEEKAKKKAEKGVNKPVDVKKALNNDINKAFETIGLLGLDLLCKGEDDSLEEFEKANKDFNKLTQRRIIDKNGVARIVWVRTHKDTGEEHDFSHGDKVKFKHEGKDVVGEIKQLKHGKDDQYGTAVIHDADGKKYSKSLLTIDKHNSDKKKDVSEHGMTKEQHEYYSSVKNAYELNGVNTEAEAKAAAEKHKQAAEKMSGSKKESKPLSKYEAQMRANAEEHKQTSKIKDAAEGLWWSKQTSFDKIDDAPMDKEKYEKVKGDIDKLPYVQESNYKVPTKDLSKDNLKNIDEKSIYVLGIGEKRYLVDSGGYDYPRHIVRLPSVKKESDKIKKALETLGLGTI